MRSKFVSATRKELRTALEAYQAAKLRPIPAVVEHAIDLADRPCADQQGTATAWTGRRGERGYIPAVSEGSQGAEPGVRLAEIIAPLSLATDLDVGQPLEHALRACLRAVRLGRACGLSDEELVDIYYLALARYVGCTANRTTHGPRR